MIEGRKKKEEEKSEMAWWLSWLERRPVTAEVVGSNPIRVARIGRYGKEKVKKKRDLSSAGRASALQAEGHRFEPCNFHLHQFLVQKCRRGGTGRRAGLKILL